MLRDEMRHKQGGCARGVVEGDLVGGQDGGFSVSERVSVRLGVVTVCQDGWLHADELPGGFKRLCGVRAGLVDPVRSESFECCLSLGASPASSAEGVAEDGVDGEVLVLQPAPGPGGPAAPFVPCATERAGCIVPQPGEFWPWRELWRRYESDCGYLP